MLSNIVFHGSDSVLLLIHATGLQHVITKSLQEENKMSI